MNTFGDYMTMIRTVVTEEVMTLRKEHGPFEAHDIPLNPLWYQKVQWREIQCDPNKPDAVCAAVKELFNDLIFHEVKHFARVPIHNLTPTDRLEHGGIVIRISLQTYPKLMATIEYMGWK